MPTGSRDWRWGRRLPFEDQFHARIAGPRSSADSPLPHGDGAEATGSGGHRPTLHRSGNAPVKMAGRPIVLTPIEFDMLLCLARGCGRVHTREQLLLEAADRDFEVFDRSIDVHIHSLRRKLGDDAKSPGFIQTIRSVGYMLVKPADDSLSEDPTLPFHKDPLSRAVEPFPAGRDFDRFGRRSAAEYEHAFARSDAGPGTGGCPPARPWICPARQRNSATSY